MTLLGFQQIVEAMLKGAPASLEGVVRLVSYLCLLTHFYDMSKGLVLLRDLLYFGSVIVFCLMITGLALQSRRS